MNEIVRELYRHHAWATLQLIEHLQTLDAATLRLSSPGTYGTIRDTLVHIVESEGGYHRITTDGTPPAPLTPDVTLDELAGLIEQREAQFEELLEDDTLPGQLKHSLHGYEMPASVPLAQLIHHADDHRTQILTILGAHGLEVPDLDVWAFATAEGRMRATAASGD